MTSDVQRTLQSFYGMHRPELLRFLRARTGDPLEAEDLLQELWLKLQRGGPVEVANSRSYLFRMAQNLVVDRQRERQRRMRRDHQWAENHGTLRHSGDEPIDASQDAESRLLEREEAAALASAIRNLPEGAQRAFVLHKIEGLSHADVAERLGISRSGVEKHIAVALKHLRRALQD